MLDRKTFFIRERAGLIKFSNIYDILEPESQAQLGIAQEKPGTLVHLLRLVLGKQLLPTKVFIYEGGDPENESRLLFSIHKGVALIAPKVDIRDRAGIVVGWLKAKAFSFGGAFRVYDAAGREVAAVKGDWKGWKFRFLDHSENEIGRITKKWAGIAKELLTTADNYIIDLNEKPEPAKAILLLAAGLAVDMVYKSGN